jgi:urease accessory protein
LESDWLIWQLCDSAFPAGAFAHSGGLEAAWQQGEIDGARGLEEWITASLLQAGRGMVPFVAAGWQGEPPLAEVDAACDAFLLNAVANRASRAQGQALLMACGKTFDEGDVARVVDAVKAGGLAGHHAPVFGALCRALAVSKRRACEVFMFLGLRGAVSGAVRLGIVGPLQGQNLQRRVSRTMPQLLGRCVDAGLDEIAQTAPLADLLQATHDRLYSRLFVS